jgi:hypothetical protein
VVAVAALFVSLSGTAWAAFVISSNSQVAPHTIAGNNAPAGGNKNLIAGSVGTADLHPGAVTATVLGTNAVTGAKVAADTLTGADVKESTLGAVPNANKLGGKPASDYLSTSNAVRIAFSGTECSQETDPGCSADFPFGALTLHVACYHEFGGDMSIVALGTSGHLGYSAYVVDSGTAVGRHIGVDEILVQEGAPDPLTPKTEAGTFVFANESTTVSVSFGATQIMNEAGPTATCTLIGTALMLSA